MSFDILIQSSNHLYVGDGPFSQDEKNSFPPDYLVSTIVDDTKRQWLIDNVTWPPYAILNEQEFTLVNILPS